MIKEINFSKKAVERISQLLSNKPHGTFFRIAVKGGGCSGFKYDFTFDTNIEKNDLVQKNIYRKYYYQKSLKVKNIII